MNVDEYKKLLSSQKTKRKPKTTKFNTHEIIFQGIKFKSALEVKCYKELKKANIEFTYEEVTFVIANSFELAPLVSYYGPLNKSIKVEKSTDPKKKTRKISYFVQDTRKISKISYTPDFVINRPEDNLMIIIETKGKENDVYPYKKKLFLKFISRISISQRKKIVFLEPHNHTQITECINIIKSL